jgi:hypothetical protein
MGYGSVWSLLGGNDLCPNGSPPFGAQKYKSARLSLGGFHYQPRGFSRRRVLGQYRCIRGVLHLSKLTGWNLGFGRASLTLPRRRAFAYVRTGQAEAGAWPTNGLVRDHRKRWKSLKRKWKESGARKANLKFSERICLYLPHVDLPIDLGI